MITRRASIAVFGLLSIPCLPWQADGQESPPAILAREHRLPFKLREGLIYIQAQVNGNRATLLVDSGAALTAFTSKIVPTSNVVSRITVNMAKGSVLAFRLPVDFTIGDPNLREQRCTFSQSAVVGDFKFQDADGLVGLDVLSQFKSVKFDFKNSILILEDH